MQTIAKTRIKSLQIGVLLIVAMLVGLISSSAFGHEWTIDGKKAKAKVVDFNGTQVLLENERGKRRAFPINELNSTDLQHLTNLLSIRNAEILKKLERQQIEQQQAQLISQFVDVWSVRMVAPNGQIGWKNYFAANSLQAKQQAWQEFPNVRITGVQRLRRAGALGGGGGGGNVGLAPVVNQMPNIPTFNSRN